MKKIFLINIWDFIDIEKLNEVLDREVLKGVPADIGYTCLEITEDGTLKLKADFSVEVE